MNQKINLFKRPWALQSWRPHAWYLRNSSETHSPFFPEHGPYDAVLPGSVQTTLLKHGVIKDWNEGLNSLDCEWVEHRHWEFFTEIEAGEIPPGEPVFLLADGLDYSGWIRVDDETVGTFRGALKRHEIDLGDALADGKKHRLSIVFDQPPEEQGQIGFTSRSEYLKPRYNFSWDWCARFVPTGIWDALSLRVGQPAATVKNFYSRLSPDLKTGTVTLRLDNPSSCTIPLLLVLQGKNGGAPIEYETELEPGDHEKEFQLLEPHLWWPNGQGDPNLYTATVFCGSKDWNSTIFEGEIGFKFVRWIPCEDAPEDARPLLCEVNGKSIFMQGVNWTPVALDYPDFDAGRYDRLIGLYHEMGANVLRVWGGGYLEREYFFQKCDELGILVWQEFPLSSSGCENYPPTGEKFIGDLCEVARDSIRRRSHHASLLLWCGGNELTTVKDAGGEFYPLTGSHPALQALEEVVASESPGIFFLPTSPSGPVFSATEETMGTGLNHHVHGPWDRFSTAEEWHRYWREDDALFRSETGVAGASDAALIRQYAGEASVLPVSMDNPYWRHTSIWWVQPNLAVGGLESYVEISQKRQADFLAFAATRCKNRFPRCAGFLVWMGHDCMPVGCNTSIINYDGTPKPAYHVLKKVFLSDPGEGEATDQGNPDE